MKDKIDREKKEAGSDDTAGPQDQGDWLTIISTEEEQTQKYRNHQEQEIKARQQQQPRCRYEIAGGAIGIKTKMDLLKPWDRKADPDQEHQAEHKTSNQYETGWG